jgi:tight adherence protein C
MPPIDYDLLTNIMAGVLLGGSGLVAVIMLTREAAMAHRRGARLRGEQTRSDGGKSSASVLAQAARQVVQGAGKVGNRMATKDPGELSVLRMRMIQAGFNGREAVPIYLGARVTGLIIAVVGSVMMLPIMFGAGQNKFIGFAAVGVLATLAVLGPDQVVKSRRRARELEYREGFPDVLDLLVASVEAGLSLDAAVSRVTEEISRRSPNLAQHIRFLTLELRAGRARKDAWNNLAERLGIDEARSFATMLRQAELMGSSLGETLSVFAAEMRTKRMLRAEEKAMALPAKLVVPMILFIFPCLLVTLMLPAAFKVMQEMSNF